MPFLRVVRDKRGYETTYLMHWFRDGSRQRSRILYVFRSPPGVRVGRDALDPAVIRELEAQHPDIEFDWRALVDNQQVIDTSPEARRGRPGRPARPEPGEGRKRRRERDDGAAPAARTPEPVAAAPVEEPAAARAPARPAVPATIEGETRELQISFLAHWYLELSERVPHRTHDPVRREALLALVERLNPSSWADEEQIASGLTHAADALQRLSRVFSKRRRRSRRSATRGAAGAHRADAPAAAAGAPPAAPPDDTSAASLDDASARPERAPASRGVASTEDDEPDSPESE